MITIKLTKKEIIQHILIWSSLIVIVNLLDPFLGSIIAKIAGSAIVFANYIFAFYAFGLIVFPKTWPTKILKLIILSLTICTTYLIIIYINFYYIVPNLNGSTHFINKPIHSFLINVFVVFLIITACSFSFYSKKIKIHSLKVQNEKEKLLLRKELNFLKNQFNSHITFNFLNFCYSHVHKISEKTAESIEIFSDMLRYTLKTKAEIKVPLEREINYIKNFIDLFKQIKGYKNINFDYQGDSSNNYIIPFILISFIKIAFKFSKADNPSFPINFKINTNYNTLIFIIKSYTNHEYYLEKENNEIKNLVQLLDIYYKDNYSIKNKFLKNEYYGELILNL